MGAGRGVFCLSTPFYLNHLMLGRVKVNSVQSVTNNIKFFKFTELPKYAALIVVTYKMTFTNLVYFFMKLDCLI